MSVDRFHLFKDWRGDHKKISSKTRYRGRVCDDLQVAFMRIIDETEGDLSKVIICLSEPECWNKVVNYKTSSANDVPCKSEVYDDLCKDSKDASKTDAENIPSEDSKNLTLEPKIHEIFFQLIEDGTTHFCEIVGGRKSGLKDFRVISSGPRNGSASELKIASEQKQINVLIVGFRNKIHRHHTTSFQGVHTRTIF
ncbi:hypothetical protein CEXT_506851 [Caerostris extrusa]|uniref:Uncharacterized protein n=1 Tax=Caerostris extrusa TaxID=172846 RepID=A0AAV4TQN4_CAEEX|nr:hypothetical protein CEXT_506851 [Caerostris extrusa]